MISKDDKIKLLSEVLAWVNSIRAEQGLEPLTALRRGRRKFSCECPIARSLCDDGSMIVAPEFRGNNWRWGVTVSGVRRPLPWAPRRFAILFDVGALPEFDEAVA